MAQVNPELARLNMIEQQIRPWDVLDQRVLDVLSQVPREQFVPTKFRNLAFADIEIPLGHGQCMMAPRVEGRMLQALDIKPTDRALEIGTGSGYVTACLARLSAQVLSVEIHRDFTERAQDKLQELGLENVHLQTGDAAHGWGAPAAHEVVVVTGSLPDASFTEPFEASLAVGGRLFVVVGQPPVMKATLITRIGEDEYSQVSLFETALKPLEGLSKPEEFTL